MIRLSVDTVNVTGCFGLGCRSHTLFSLNSYGCLYFTHLALILLASHFDNLVFTSGFLFNPNLCRESDFISVPFFLSSCIELSVYETEYLELGSKFRDLSPGKTVDLSRVYLVFHLRSAGIAFSFFHDLDG